MRDDSGSSGDSLPEFPMLCPGLRILHRPGNEVQVGLVPGRAVVLADDGALGVVLPLLDGCRSFADLTKAAATGGVPAAQTLSILYVLAKHGALVDGRERLEPAFAAVRLVHGANSCAAVVDARRRARVEIRDCERVGAALADLLAAAGVGHLVLAGVAAEQTAARVRGAHPATALTCASAHSSRTFVRSPRPDIVILSPVDGEPDREDVDHLVRDGIPHLVVRIEETRAVLGPFVVPGETACLRCTDLQRTARDAAWPALLSQLTSRSGPAQACDPSLASLVASQASLEVLALLAGGNPHTLGAALETSLPSGVTRRRRWPIHPECGCSWAQSA